MGKLWTAIILLIIIVIILLLGLYDDYKVLKATKEKAELLQENLTRCNKELIRCHKELKAWHMRQTTREQKTIPVEKMLSKPIYSVDAHQKSSGDRKTIYITQKALDDLTAQMKKNGNKGDFIINRVWSEHLGSEWREGVVIGGFTTGYKEFSLHLLGYHIDEISLFYDPQSGRILNDQEIS